MVAEWGFDGVYLDFQGLSAVPPCFNPAHQHATPLAGFESVPKVFEEIHADLHACKSDPFLEACICALAALARTTCRTTRSPTPPIRARTPRPAAG